jgi:hypothetical protein
VFEEAAALAEIGPELMAYQLVINTVVVVRRDKTAI